MSFAFIITVQSGLGLWEAWRLTICCSLTRCSRLLYRVQPDLNAPCINNNPSQCVPDRSAAKTASGSAVPRHSSALPSFRRWLEYYLIHSSAINAAYAGAQPRLASHPLRRCPQFVGIIHCENHACARANAWGLVTRVCVLTVGLDQLAPVARSWRSNRSSPPSFQC